MTPTRGVGRASVASVNGHSCGDKSCAEEHVQTLSLFTAGVVAVELSVLLLPGIVSPNHVV